MPIVGNLHLACAHVCCCLFQCDTERQLLSVACWLRAYTLHHLLSTVCDPYYTK